MASSTISPSATATVDSVPATLEAVSAFVASLDQHPFGALVLIIILVTIVVAIVRRGTRT